MSNKVDGKDFIIGAVVGGLLGAMTALLLAPKSGRELRKDIAEGYETISDKTHEIVSTVSDKTSAIAKTAAAQTSEWVDKAKEVAGTVVGEVKTWRDKSKLAGSSGTGKEADSTVISESAAGLEQQENN
jgi:gas vesicle protein